MKSATTMMERVNESGRSYTRMGGVKKKQKKSAGNIENDMNNKDKVKEEKRDNE